MSSAPGTGTYSAADPSRDVAAPPNGILFEQLCDQIQNQQHTLDILTSKVDTMMSMLNAVMLNQAQQNPIPYLSDGSLAAEPFNPSVPVIPSAVVVQGGPSGVLQVAPAYAAAAPSGDAATSSWGDETELKENLSSESCSPDGHLDHSLARQLSFDHSSGDDVPNDDYDLNRENPEIHAKSFSTVPFSPEDKSQDFAVWITQFEDAVNRDFNPHSKRRHHKYCLKWLPSCLSTDAYVVWKRHKSCKDWEQLKEKLLLELEDPSFRIKWSSNPFAYPWDENKESLTSYCAKVKRYVDTFDTDIAGVPKAKRNQYYRRFVNGLPPDYQDKVKMGTSYRRQDVDRALDICLRHQSLKKGNSDINPEMGASFF